MHQTTLPLKCKNTHSRLRKLRSEIVIHLVRSKNTQLISFILFYLFCLSLLEWLFLHIVLVFLRRLHVPGVALMRKIRVVKKTITWLPVTDHPSIIVTKWILFQLLVWPHVRSSVHLRILPRIVDKHRRIKLISDSLFKMFQSLTKESWTLRYIHNFLKPFPGNPDVIVIVISIAPVLIDSPLLFPSQKTSW